MKFHNITKDDMKNGEGLRVVLWVSGCEHQCPGCHNVVTWNENDGIIFDNAAKKELFEELEKTYISGITFSGGDPLYPKNRQEIGTLSKEIAEKFPHKTIWLYTGYVWEEIKDLDWLKFVDVIVDGRFVQEQKDVKLHWKGSKNQRVIDVKQTLENCTIIEFN